MPNKAISLRGAETTGEGKGEQATSQSPAEIRLSVQEGASFNIAYVTMNVLATIVACCGLLANSTAVVIGAMIIAMLLGPITGLALALVDGDNELLVKSLLAEAGGAALVFATAFVIGKVSLPLPITNEMLARTSPNLLDLFIALAGGTAGAYATVSPRLKVGLVGVAIATALVPPLSTAAMCLARGQKRYALGAFLLYFANLVAIQVASSVVMWFHGYHRLTNRTPERRGYAARIAVSLFLLFALTGLLGYNLFQSINRQRFEADTQERLVKALEAYPGCYLAELRFQREKGGEIILAVVRTPYSFDPAKVIALERQLPPCDGKPVGLHIRSVLMKETTREGYMHELPQEKIRTPEEAQETPLP